MVGISNIVAYPNLFGQSHHFESYYTFKEQMMQQDSAGNFAAALLSCDSMLHYVDFYPYDYYSCFVLAVRANEMEKARSYLQKGTVKGLTIAAFYSDEKTRFFETPAGNEFLQIQDSLIGIHASSIDMAYYMALRELKERDQFIRDGSVAMIRNDSLVFDELIRLGLKKGFPTFKCTGYGANYAWLILWHQRDLYPDSDQWKQVIPLIEKQMDQGLLEPKMFEPFEDYKTKQKIRQ